MSNDRFDKFTSRARQVLTLAQEEATRFNHNYIGTEHLLLGLVREGEGVAARVLTNLGVELNRVRSAVEFIIGRGDRMIVGEISLTPRAKMVIELAVDEARRFGHHYIGTEHLLLGLVREGSGIAAGVLESLGVNLEKVRTQTIQVLAGLGSAVAAAEETTGPMAGAAAPMPGSLQSGDADRFDQFTERARQALTLAQEEATRFNHNYIGTEHLLLGLVREGEGIAAKVLTNLGVELNQVRGAVEAIIGRGDGPVTGEIGLTPRTKKVMALAVDEARRLGHHYIGTEHLLLGLIREGEGIASGVLESLGVSLEKVRTQTIQVLSQTSSGAQGPSLAGASGVQLHPDRPEQVWPAEAVRQWAGGGPSEQQRPATAAPATRARWQYCIVQVTYPDSSGSGVVGKVYGGGDEDRFGHGATPVYQALQTLGVEGWELVAVEPGPAHPGSAPPSAHYVFKRPR